MACCRFSSLTPGWFCAKAGVAKQSTNPANKCLIFTFIVLFVYILIVGSEIEEPAG
jgi:hypothetical protein